MISQLVTIHVIYSNHGICSNREHYVPVGPKTKVIEFGSTKNNSNISGMMSTSLSCRKFETESGEGPTHSSAKIALHLILTVEVNFFSPKI